MSCNVAVLQPRIRRNGCGLGSSPFARHYWGNHCLFSVPAGTKMFQFPALASIIDGWYLFKVPGCPIRKSADRRSFAPPRGLSQLITSFIASESQGIRHAPLLTFLVTYTHIFLNMCGMTYTSCCLAFSGNWFILLLVTSCHRAFCVECAESDRVRGRPEGSPAPLYRETNISAVQGRKHHEDKVSPERRCSSRTFRYGYLVTT